MASLSTYLSLFPSLSPSKSSYFIVSVIPLLYITSSSSLSHTYNLPVKRDEPDAVILLEVQEAGNEGEVFLDECCWLLEKHLGIRLHLGGRELVNEAERESIWVPTLLLLLLIWRARL